MQEETVIEGDVVNTPQADSAAAEPQDSSWEPVLRETARLFESLGKALVSTAQDLSSLMVIRVDHETRERLDLLVEAGVARNRREGAEALITEGFKTQQDVFEKIERTRAQISALKAQLRTLAGVRSE